MGQEGQCIKMIMSLKMKVNFQIPLILRKSSVGGEKRGMPLQRTEHAVAVDDSGARGVSG